MDPLTTLCMQNCVFLFKADNNCQASPSGRQFTEQHSKIAEINNEYDLGGIFLHNDFSAISFKLCNNKHEIHLCKLS